MIYAIVAVVVLALVGFAAWFFWPVSSRRRTELNDPAKRFHWGVITSYMGNADPTMLAREEAAGILSNGWSTPSGASLREKMSLYRRGEINDAFDAARIVWLAELAAAAGWMDANEVSQWSAEACARVRSKHANWAAFGEQLWVGRQRWWAEVARSPMPEGDRTRAGEIRNEVAPLWASIPWA